MIIYRAGTVLHNVVIDESTVLTKALMGVDIIKSSFVSSTMLDIKTGDYVVFKGLNYVVNQLPVILKTSSRGFKYDVNFEGYQYAISEAAFLNNNRADVSLYTNVDTMLTAIRNNLNRVGITSWSFTNTATTQEFKNIAFSNDNCLSALQKIVKEFNIEWYLIGHQIVVCDRVGNPTGLSFRYKVGLRDITRLNSNKSNLVTSLWAYGGIQNIPFTYKDGISRLCLDAPVQNNVSLYGIKEASVNYDDIYPQRTGTVTTAIDRMFTDSSMDFDINSYLVPKVAAKIIFKTGLLVGYLFDMAAYDNATKTFQIKYYNDPSGFSLPNLNQVIQAGDKYTIVDIFMPQSYIDEAEAVLTAKAEEELGLLSVPRVTYKINPDWRNFKKDEITLNTGDSLTVIDDDLSPLGITSRIIQLEQTVLNPYKYVITVADSVTYSIVENVIGEQRNINNIIKVANLQDSWRSRANWMNTQELKNMIFDPDGYFDQERLKVLEIDTGMLSVGFKGAQFCLKDVIFRPNFENNPNRISISSGVLEHYTIDPSGVKTWAIGTVVINDLTANTGYYIYVRANKTIPGADWLISTIQYMTDTPGNYYYFLVGVIHSALFNGKRQISLTYGSTTITGEFITTGRIASTDGQTYFDLNSGVISGRIVFRSGRTAEELESDLEAMQTQINNMGYVPPAPGDVTQTLIDGGIITTGRIEVGGGTLGQGNSGINGSVSASPALDVRFWAGSQFANRATAPFRVQNDGKIISTYGLIGGWNIAPDGIYTGTKSLANGFNPNQGFTLGADGSVHAPAFYINNNGSIGMAALATLSMEGLSGHGLVLGASWSGSDMWENLSVSDSGALHFNYKGYQGGFSKFRDMNIYDGKGSILARFGGFEKSLYVYGDLGFSGKLISKNSGNYSATGASKLIYTLFEGIGTLWISIKNVATTIYSFREYRIANSWNFPSDYGFTLVGSLNRGGGVPGLSVSPSSDGNGGMNVYITAASGFKVSWSFAGAECEN